MPTARDEAWADAVARLDRMTAMLAADAVVGGGVHPGRGQGTQPHPAAGLLSAVERAKEEIRAGEAFQIVVSQRFEASTTADALDVYPRAASGEPEPLHACCGFQAPTVAGTGRTTSSAPARRRWSRVTGDRVMTHPIAGTRWRGTLLRSTPRSPPELLGDPEGARRAPLTMLVDLSRNDIGRVCEPRRASRWSTS